MTGRYDKLLADWPHDVPMERIVRQRLGSFDELVAQGVTWSSIAAALARAGITRRNGGQLSGRQLNAVYLRNSGLTARPANVTPALQPIRTAVDDPTPAAPARRPPPAAATRGSGIANRLAEARTFRRQVNDPYDD